MKTRIIDAVFGIFSTIKSRSGGVTVDDNLTVTGTLSSTGAVSAPGIVVADDSSFGAAESGAVVTFYADAADTNMVWNGDATALELNGSYIQIAGTTDTGVTSLIKDGAGDILLATGTTVPTNDTAGYAKGCLFIDTDVAKGTTGLYCNKGTATECTFTAVTQA